ncbi:MAG: hypothetical protein ACPG5U_07865 [Planktomarina sp.]
MIRFAIAFVTLCTPSIGYAELSSSEQAALDERAPTAAERARHQEQCAINPVQVGRLNISSNVQATLTKLPAMTFLKAVEVVFQGPEAETFVPVAYNDVENGGIAGFDLCGRTDIVTFIKPTTKGDIVKIITLRLRVGLDLQTEYPATSVEVLDRKMIISNDSETYAVLNLSEPATRHWYDTSAGSWAVQNSVTQGLIFGDTLALRMPR